MPQRCDVLQPQYFERFRCTGAECEDTCCEGWGILIDRDTWDKYRDPALKGLVEINPASCSSGDFAKIRLSGTRCPALSNGLCSIQQGWGEPWLSDMCSNYPRVLNGVRGKMERSLHLSCPEAARLVLTDPDAMVFEVRGAEEILYRPGVVSTLSVTDEMHASRELFIGILRDRSRPLGSRIEALGRAIDGLAGRKPDTAPAIDGVGVSALQLETVLELVVGRIGGEYTSPRFLECYGEFMRGLHWTGESTMEELVERYRFVRANDFTPFEARHPYLFENYLINYVFRTLFPWGRKSPDQKISADCGEKSIRDAFVLMVTHYAIIRTLLIGMAGLHGNGLKIAHAVKLVQSCTRVFQHSSSIAEEMLAFLDRQPNGLARRIAMLVAD